MNDKTTTTPPGDAPAGYWWCPVCKEEVGSYHVTHQEKHERCGHPVEWCVVDLRIAPAAPSPRQDPTPGDRLMLGLHEVQIAWKARKAGTISADEFERRVGNALLVIADHSPSPRPLPSREDVERAVDAFEFQCRSRYSWPQESEAARASLLKLIPTKENDK